MSKKRKAKKSTFIDAISKNIDIPFTSAKISKYISDKSSQKRPTWCRLINLLLLFSYFWSSLRILIEMNLIESLIISYFDWPAWKLFLIAIILQNALILMVRNYGINYVSLLTLLRKTKSMKILIIVFTTFDNWNSLWFCLNRLQNNCISWSLKRTKQIQISSLWRPVDSSI